MTATMSMTNYLKLANENARLRAGIKEIDRFLTENRIGDALFVCDALLTCGDEQLGTEK